MSSEYSRKGKGGFYGVRKGRHGLQACVFMHWHDCKAFVEGYEEADYRVFADLEDAAEYAMMMNNNNSPTPSSDSSEDESKNYSENDNDESEEDELILVDGYGFPEENGVILVDDEVILYRQREGKVLKNLQI